MGHSGSGEGAEVVAADGRVVVAVEMPVLVLVLVQRKGIEVMPKQMK